MISSEVIHYFNTSNDSKYRQFTLENISGDKLQYFFHWIILYPINCEDSSAL